MCSYSSRHLESRPPWTGHTGPFYPQKDVTALPLSARVFILCFRGSMHKSLSDCALPQLGGQRSTSLMKPIWEWHWMRVMNGWTKWAKTDRTWTLRKSLGRLWGHWSVRVCMAERLITSSIKRYCRASLSIFSLKRASTRTFSCLFIRKLYSCLKSGTTNKPLSGLLNFQTLSLQSEQGCPQTLKRCSNQTKPSGL